MASQTIVIVGGALSGPTAAARARETDEGARIILLERGPHVSYAVAGPAYYLSGEVASRDALDRERARFFRDVYGVEVRTRTPVARLDPARRAVHLQRGQLAYDALVYAAGAESVIPAVPGLAGAANVCRFRTLTDLEGILALLKRGARRVAILGGGFFGVEAADGFLRRGCQVTLLERGPRILPRFSPALSAMAAEALRAAGAAVRTGAAVERAERRGERVRSLALAQGPPVAADVVVVAAGLRPRTDLLREAGAALAADGSVAVDERCAASLPGVYACGVCVSLPHAVSGHPVWFAQAAQADKTAQVAGACAAGGEARMGPVLGTAVVRAGEVALARTGLTGEEAAAFAGEDLASVQVHAPARDPYLRDATPVTLQLLYHRRTGRILGAETAGATGADKRIDVLAAAILGGLTMDQLATLDLAYAPPFSAARDPVNVAGAVASAALRDLARPWTASQVASLEGGLVLVDVRPPAARKAQTVQGALRIPLERLRARLGEIPATGPVVFLSETGRRGYLAARIARQRGHPDAGYLSGGFRSWLAEGHPLTRGG